MIISRYTNGNCTVTLESDGTKVREYEGTPAPEFPESIDLKITSRCDLGCEWCHECATPDGDHASVDWILRALGGLPAGVEVAIGGGNPLEHPQLTELLKGLKTLGIIANMTVNAGHLYCKTIDQIDTYRGDGLIYGLGISYRSLCRTAIESASDENTIVHFIAGIHTPMQLMNLEPKKALILGYKDYGRGKGANVDLGAWNYWLPRMLRTFHLAFDNLALRQLRVKELVPGEVWGESFMGDDGAFTMYVDAVRQEYAKNSTAQRIPAEGLCVADMFRRLRQPAA